MGAADGQRPGNDQADEPNAGGHRLSLAEWLVLCLVREEPTYGLVIAQLLDRDGSLGQIWSVQKGSVYLALQRLLQQRIDHATRCLRRCLQEA